MAACPRTSRVVAYLLLTIGLLTGFVPARWAAWAQEPGATGGLHIVIIEGEGAVNNTKQRVGREPVVEVQDRNNRPVAGATVTFLLPNNGASAVFTNGAKLLTVQTDQAGRATATLLRANKLPGQYNINVTANYQGQTARATIAQSNVVAAGAAGAGALGMSATTLGIVAGALAAGLAVGVYKATSGGSPNARASVGAPTVGAP